MNCTLSYICHCAWISIRKVMSSCIPFVEFRSYSELIRQVFGLDIDVCMHNNFLYVFNFIFINMLMYDIS